MAKILLVEDDNNLREIYEARLMAEGYDIVSARDGEEALTVAMKEKPDLIISDVMMPKISGFDMLDILRTTEETKHVKIIMMTALSQAEDKARAEKLGADRYLVKSQVTLEDVAKVAKEVLEGTSSETQTVAPAPEPQPAVAQPQLAPVAMPAPVTPAVTAATVNYSTPEPTQTVAPAPEPQPAVAQPQLAPVVDPLAQISAQPSSASQPITTEPAAQDETPQPVPAPAVATTQSEEEAIAKQIEGMMTQSAAPLDNTIPMPSAEVPTTATNVTINEAPSTMPSPAPTPITIDQPAEAVSPTSSTKRVIEPITDFNTVPKTNLNELITQEENKEMSAIPTPQPMPQNDVQPAPAVTPQPTPPASPSQNTVDPNSIAL